MTAVLTEGEDWTRRQLRELRAERFRAALRGARRRGLLDRPAATAERLGLTAGVAYVVAEYFGHARAPEARVLRAGRSVAALRTAALALAASGRRRAADRLLLASTAAAVAAGVRRLRSAEPA